MIRIQPLTLIGCQSSGGARRRLSLIAIGSICSGGKIGGAGSGFHLAAETYWMSPGWCIRSL